jgi:hypothetical protein
VQVFAQVLHSVAGGPHFYVQPIIDGELALCHAAFQCRQIVGRPQGRLLCARAGRIKGMQPKPTQNRELLARAELILKIASPEVAAEKLGWPINDVMSRRRELGVPDPVPDLKRRRSRHGELLQLSHSETHSSSSPAIGDMLTPAPENSSFN